MNGKPDTLDAQNAARAVLAGTATATPKSADGKAEMIRQLKIAHDQALEQRPSAKVTMKAMLVRAPAELRREPPRRCAVRRGAPERGGDRPLRRRPVPASV